jgi:hypothetical protein
MPKKEKVERCRCRECGKKYDPIALDRSLGRVMWAPLYCSPQCYTDATITRPNGPKLIGLDFKNTDASLIGRKVGLREGEHREEIGVVTHAAMRRITVRWWDGEVTTVNLDSPALTIYHRPEV